MDEFVTQEEFQAFLVTFYTELGNYQPLQRYDGSPPFFGNEGDYFFDTATATRFERRNNLWNMIDYSTIPTIYGSLMYSFQTPPNDDAVGVDGDLWYNTNTNLLYGPKAGGTWTGVPSVDIGSGGGGSGVVKEYQVGVSYQQFDIIAQEGELYTVNTLIPDTVNTSFNDILPYISMIGEGDGTGVIKPYTVGDSYVAGDIISYQGELYTVVTAINGAVNTGFSDVQSHMIGGGIAAYAELTPFSVDDIITYQGGIYRVNTAISAGANTSFLSMDVTPIGENSGITIYAAGVAYSELDLITHEGNLYRVNTAITDVANTQFSDVDTTSLSGGGALEILSQGASLGNFTKLNFLGTDVQAIADANDPDQANVYIPYTPLARVSSSISAVPALQNGFAYMGETVTEVTLNWAWNETPDTQNVIGTGTLPTLLPSSQTGDVTGLTETDDESWTLNATSAVYGNASINFNLRFANRIYYGKSELATINNSTDVVGLSQDIITNNYERTYTTGTGTADTYFYICVPTRIDGNGMGLWFDNDNNAPVNFSKVETGISVTNDATSPVTETYEIYRSVTQFAGSLNIEVTEA